MKALSFGDRVLAIGVIMVAQPLPQAIPDALLAARRADSSSTPGGNSAA